MTENHAELSSSLKQVEAKVDGLAVQLAALTIKVEARDQQGNQFERLLDRAAQRDEFFLERLNAIEQKIEAAFSQATKDTNGLRTDIEGRLHDRVVEGNRVHDALLRDVERLQGVQVRQGNSLASMKTAVGVAAAVGTASLAGVVGLLVKAFGGG